MNLSNLPALRVAGLLLAATLAPALLAADAAPAAAAVPASPADRAFAEFKQLLSSSEPGTFQSLGPEKYLRWRDDHLRRIYADGQAFYQAYPNDPRRWSVVIDVIANPPWFIQSFGPGVAKDGLKSAVYDASANAGWQRQTEAWKQALLASSDATSAQKESIEWSNCMADLMAGFRALEQGKPADLAPARARFIAYADKYLNEPEAAQHVYAYLGELETISPGAGFAEWRRFVGSPNAELREMAHKRLAVAEARAQSFDFAFTAADGRAVDLGKLRGKVVLVDFWATWCGPCREEIPNVRKVYAAYRDQGFEVVGIPLEHARVKPTDTPEQRAAKLASARQNLLAFTAKNEMSWPQDFDGASALAEKYGVEFIPAMFLVDRTGRLVTANARGAELEAQVKRLLGL